MISKKLTPLIDSHCHLDFPEFASDIDAIIARSHDVGITKILTICTKPANLRNVKTISDKFLNVFFAVGSHPLNTLKIDKFSYEQLIMESTHKKMIGIGETGLDYFYSKNTSEEQKLHFKLHIAAARECNLPVIVHSRSADEDMSKILLEEYKIAPFECVMHCFSSSLNLARTAIDLGFYLSISGIATFPKSDALRELFSTMPKDQLLLETDSPYLAPAPFRGKRNEPSYLAKTASYIAEYLELTEDDLRKQTTDNFNNLFKKANN